MIKPTIRNKLIAGFTGVLVLMSLIAGIGCYAVFSLRHSAQDAVRIGSRLNSISLEIQVHNLEAQRRITAYLASHAGPTVASLKAEDAQAADQYLEEAQFEIQEIQQLSARAVKIAPNAEKRAKFEKVAAGVDAYQAALDGAVSAAKAGPGSPAAKAALEAYEASATHLHEAAEDGEVAGREAAQLSQQEIQTVSSRSVLLVSVFSIAGLVLGFVVSLTLSRAILNPVDHLREVADNVSLGNLDIAVRRYSNDEIGDLADSFSRMVTAVKFFKYEAEDAALLAAATPPKE
jgi:HAMP domain-containing protein